MTTNIKPKSISQHKLRRYLELEEFADEFKALREEILKMAESGLPSQPGPLSCHITTKAGQRRPAWKDEGVGLANSVGMDGDKWAEKIIKLTSRGKQSCSLAIVDRDKPMG